MACEAREHGQNMPPLFRRKSRTRAGHGDDVDIRSRSGNQRGGLGSDVAVRKLEADAGPDKACRCRPSFMASTKQSSRVRWKRWRPSGRVVNVAMPHLPRHVIAEHGMRRMPLYRMIFLF